MSNTKKTINTETNSKEETKVNTEITVEKTTEQLRNEKKKLRRAQIENAGALHLDEKYKKPGFRQRLVNVIEGNLNKRELEGYRLIPMSEGQVGDGAVNTSHSTGGTIEVEVGRRNSMKAVWMEISEEDALILDEIRDDKAREQNAMIEKSDIPENARIGKVTREE